MKVGEQRINHPKAKSWRDEETRFRFASRQELTRIRFGCAKGRAFQSPHCGRAHRQDGSPGTFGTTDLVRRFHRNLIGFAVHHMPFQCFCSNGLESPQANVQGELANLNSTLSDLFEDFRSEMQSRSGSRDRTRLAGENGLVPFVVRSFVGPIDVRRKWYVTQAVNLVIHCRTLAGSEPQGTLTLIAVCDYFRLKFTPAELHSLADMKFFARSN